MIKEQILAFLFRWLVSSTGMWLCISLFGEMSEPYTVWLFVAAGLVFSLVNVLIKPLLTIFSLPLIIVSMGLFVVVINIAMMGLTIWLLPGVSMGVGGAILSAVVMGLVNSLVNFVVPSYNRE